LDDVRRRGARATLRVRARSFFDIGSCLRFVRDLTLRGWKHGQGVVLRIEWNQSTVGAFDFGFSDEDAAFYTDFNHPFITSRSPAREIAID